MLTLNTLIGKTLPDTTPMRDDVQKAKDIEARIDSLINIDTNDRFGMFVAPLTNIYIKEGK